jgi:hypothetical protein
MFHVHFPLIVWIGEVSQMGKDTIGHVTAPIVARGVCPGTSWSDAIVSL